jgi:hypothetical protein
MYAPQLYLLRTYVRNHATTHVSITMWLPILVAARSNVSVWGHSPAGIAGLNPVGGMNVGLLWVLCVVR